MRIFVSIEWSEEMIGFLRSWQEKLQQEYGVKGYWRKSNNLHLTLKFLGEVEESKIPLINNKLREFSSHYGNFDIHINGLGVFPNIKSPRILWMGVQSTVLYSLQAEIENSLRNLGFPPEYKRYQPHITLASGGISGIDETNLNDIRIISRTERVSSFELMQSVVERGNRIYRTLERYSFKKDDARL